MDQVARNWGMQMLSVGFGARLTNALPNRNWARTRPDTDCIFKEVFCHPANGEIQPGNVQSASGVGVS